MKKQYANNDLIGSIYQLIFPNNKIYHGKTIHNDPKLYLLSHKNDAEKDSQRLVHKAIRKYGWENIQKVWLHYKNVHPDFLDDMEKYYIRKYQTNNIKYGYNMTEGGDGVSGFIPNIESRQKMSKAQKGRKHSEETKRKISEGNKGKFVSKESRQKMSKSHKGKTLSPEHKQKIAEGNKGRIVSKETRKKLSEGNKGKPGSWTGRKHSDETKKKMSEWQIGKVVSKETREKISKTLKERNAKLRGANHEDEKERV